MTRVIIVHGFKGKPDTNWKPWLVSRLKETGVDVIVPEMPNTDSPIADEWVNNLSKVVQDPNEDLFLVGHSLGCITILRYLEGLREGEKVGGCIFVAGFTGKFELYKGGHDSFFDHELDWARIKEHCDSFVAIHSEDDMNVEQQQLNLFESKLDAKTVLVNGMGHFGSNDGVYEVPLVRDELEKLMSKVGKR